MTLRFGSKVPGSQMEVRDVAMDFLYGEAFTESSPEAYERLLLDVLLGDASLFPHNQEVEDSWRVIDPHRALLGRAEREGRRARALPRRRVGTCRGGRHARPRRTLLEKAMTTLWDTTGTAVVKALAAERRQAGSVSSGLALTLVVVTDEKHVADAEAAATHAAAQHPCRLLVVVRRRPDAPRRGWTPRCSSAAGSVPARPS